ncbi:GNAT family N-acetyltransferase [Longibaculum muris]|uniref:GNAT family N-acetyltransferase n=1 Tax=Longibaculum muris TaxID=1796628 RepID=UPI003AB7EAE5
MEILENPALSKKELDDVVKIHMETFPGFFLTFLGKGFLRQMYKGFIAHEKSGLIVAKNEIGIVGVLAYSENLSAFYKYLIKTRLIPFAWYSLGAIIRQPSAMVRLIRAFLKPSETKREEKYVELSSIGVSPKTKGQHIGSKMIDKLKEMFDANKFAYINLETDATNNEGVNVFYIKNGFKLERSFETPEGRKMNEYRWVKK